MRRVFFLHIEKCAGTSVRDAMTRAMQPHATTPAGISYLDGEAASGFARGHELDPWTVRDQHLGYLLSSRYSQFVTGHYRFDETLHGPFSKRWIFTLVLRDPVDRFLSHFYYNRHKKGDFGRIEESLGDYINTRRAPKAANVFVTLLAARPNHYAPIKEADIRRACRNLREFRLIGLLEDLGDYCRRFEELVGEPLDVPVLNRSPAAKKRHEEIPDEQMARIRELCEPSMRVYKEAQRLIALRAERAQARQVAP
ncbi:MAG: sulfotransferase family 2 domain-containing protein [Pseudomonadota bacterium]